MNKIERELLSKNGKIILRPQWNQRKQIWNIVQYSKKRGWIKIDFKAFLSKENCEKAIDNFIEKHPNVFIKD